MDQHPAQENPVEGGGADTATLFDDPDEIIDPPPNCLTAISSQIGHILSESSMME